MDTRSNLPWLTQRTLYLSRHGSHAYGTATPTSDVDLRGFAVPPRAYYHGYLQRFEQGDARSLPEGAWEQAGLRGDLDLVVFALGKFVALCAECNPNALEVLFTDPSDHVVVTPLGERVLAARRLFLSRKARHTFSGYAISQLRRIETHRRWLLHPPGGPPDRVAMGLPPRTLIPKDQLAAAESLMRKKVEAWGVDMEPLDEASKIQLAGRIAEALAEMSLGASEQMSAAGRVLGFSDNFLEVLDRERHYQSAQREWEQFRTWQRGRNPARAAIEARYGYDCKHGMHLVRLLRMCRELLATGELRVRRADAEELLTIRNGAWSYDQLIEYAKGEEAALEDLAARSALPREPDRAGIDRLCIEVTEEALRTLPE